MKSALSKVAKVDKFYKETSVSILMSPISNNKLKIYTKELNNLSDFLKIKITEYENSHLNHIQFEKVLYNTIYSKHLKELTKPKPNGIDDNLITNKNKVKNTKSKLFHYFFKLFKLTMSDENLMESSVMSEINCFLFNILLIQNGLCNNNISFFVDLRALLYFIENRYMSKEFKYHVIEFFYRDINKFDLSDIIILNIFLSKSKNKEMLIDIKNNINQTDLILRYNILLEECKKSLTLNDLLKILRLFVVDGLIHKDDFLYKFIINAIPFTIIKPRQVNISESIELLKILSMIGNSCHDEENLEYISIIHNNINHICASIVLQIDNTRKKDGVVRSFERLESIYPLMYLIFDNIKYFKGEGLLSRLYELVVFSQSQKITIDFISITAKFYYINKEKYYDILADYYLNIIKTQPLFYKHTSKDLLIIGELCDYKPNSQLSESLSNLFCNLDSNQNNRIVTRKSDEASLVRLINKTNNC